MHLPLYTLACGRTVMAKGNGTPQKHIPLPSGFPMSNSSRLHLFLGAEVSPSQSLAGFAPSTDATLWPPATNELDVVRVIVRLPESLTVASAWPCVLMVVVAETGRGAPVWCGCALALFAVINGEVGDWEQKCESKLAWRFKIFSSKVAKSDKCSRLQPVRPS